MKLFNMYALAALLACFCACSDNQPQPSAESSPSVPLSGAELVKRGNYLVTTMGCNDCHSPKRMGARGPEIIPETMLSGYPSDRPFTQFTDPKNKQDLARFYKQGFSMFFPDLTAAAGPWGISFAANLTPDDTGLGTWTEAQFKIALTQGKSKGMESSRMLLPPMPWVNYITMEDSDIKAIFAYLKSIKPVKNVVPAPIPPDTM